MKRKKIHNKVRSKSYLKEIPELPVDISLLQIISYISNCNNLYSFFPDRISRVFKCYVHNETNDIDMQQDFQYLYRLVDYYRKSENADVIEDISNLANDLYKRSINEIDNFIQSIQRNKTIYCQQLVFLIQELLNNTYGLHSTNDTSDCVMKVLNVIDFIERRDCTEVIHSYVYQYLLTLLHNKETIEDHILICRLCTNGHLLNNLNNTIMTPYERDEEFDIFMFKLLHKDMTYFHKMPDIIHRIKYVINRHHFKSISNAILHHMNVSEIHQMLKDYMYKV